MDGRVARVRPGSGDRKRVALMSGWGALTPVSRQRAQQKQSSKSGWDGCTVPAAHTGADALDTTFSRRQHSGSARSTAVHARRKTATYGTMRRKTRNTSCSIRAVR